MRTEGLVTTYDWNGTNSTTSALLLSTDTSSVLHILGVVTVLLNGIALPTNIIGNVIIIVAVSRYHWLGKPLFAMIQMLAVTDLSVCLHIVNSIMKASSFYPHETYVLARDILTVTVYAATLHVGLSTIERFAAIIFPLKYHRYASFQLIRRCSAAALTFLGIVWALRIYFTHLVTFSTGRSIVGHTVPSILVYCLYTVALFYLHWKIHRVAKHRRHVLCCHIRQGNNQKQQRVHRATKMIIIVVGMFLIRWAPFVVSCAMALIRGTIDKEMESILDLTMVIREYNSCFSCFIYYHYNEKMRTAFRKMLRLGAWNTDITRRL